MQAGWAKLKKGNWNEWLAWLVWVLTCFMAVLLIGGITTAALMLIGYGGLISGTLGEMVLSAFIYIALVLLLLSSVRLRHRIKLSPAGKFLVAATAAVLVYVLHVFNIGGLGAQLLVAIAAGLILVLSSIPVKQRTVTKAELGVARPMSWGDIGLGMAGYVIYLIIFVAITLVLTKLVPSYDSNQSQDLGFTMLFGIERMIGFIVLVVITPVVEELIMRGFLFGKLRKAQMPFWPAAVVVSVLFGLAHGQWNVGIDTFVLSMIACYLREATGTIWPGVIIHMLKNAVAYVLLFVFVIR